MSNFFSASQEEQQEILLGLWDRYKYLIVLVLVAPIFFIVSRDYLLSSSEENDFISATLYQSYLETEDKKYGDKILQDFPNTVYADFVRLNEAKKSFKSDEFEEAIQYLNLVINNNAISGEEFNPLRVAAQIRLSKIYMEQSKYKEVIQLFENSELLTSSMLEIKGDAQNKLGDYSAARVSYLLALQNSTNQASQAMINMKISDLDGGDIE